MLGLSVRIKCQSYVLGLHLMKFLKSNLFSIVTFQHLHAQKTLLDAQPNFLPIGSPRAIKPRVFEEVVSKKLHLKLAKKAHRIESW